MAVFLLMIVFMIGTIVGTIGFAVSARRRRVPHALVAVAAITLFCACLIASFSAIHVVAVAGRALAGKGNGPGGTFAYDFRFYSLILLGVMLIAAAVACLVSVRSLTRGDAAGRGVAMSAIVVLLVLNVPLMPIEGFATAFTVFAVVNLVALWCAPRPFRAASVRSVAGPLSVTASAGPP